MVNYRSAEDLWFGPVQGFPLPQLKKIRGINQARALMDSVNIETNDQAIRTVWKRYIGITLR